MVTLSVSIHVKPEHIDEFLVAMLANGRGSRTEPGNLRYDILRDDADPCHIMLYEVYKDKDALAAHRETPHFKAWAAAVEPWLVKPRERVVATPIFYDGIAL